MKKLIFLEKKLKRKSGINNLGFRVNYNKSGGHKKKYKYVDFSTRWNNNRTWTILKHLYDANRTAYITLIIYNKHIFFSPYFFKYILARKGVKEGNITFFDNKSRIKAGLHICCLQNNIWNNLTNSTRAAGTTSIIFRITSDKIVIKLPSKKIIFINKQSFFFIGQITKTKKKTHLKKAGRSRWLGKKPTVRAVAMNPIDHPHGGGNGKSKSNRHPVTFKGILTRGIKTKK